MTFEDDFLLFQTPSGPRRIRCQHLNIQWPPPETIRLRGFEPPYTDIDFKLLRRSEISDADRSELTHVCRGAEYVYASKVH